jgi:hypothetical protein
VYFCHTFKKVAISLFFSGASNGLHRPEREVGEIGLAPALQLDGIWSIRTVR